MMLSEEPDGSVQCPACGQTIPVPKSLIGKRGRCACGQVFRIAPPPHTTVIDAITPPIPSATLPAPGKFCVTCGNGLHIRAEICPKCGVRQPILTSSKPSDTSKTILPAFLLLIFLGFIGAHAFYAGRIESGVIYVLCFVTGFLLLVPWVIMLVLWVMDFIYVVTGTYQDGRGLVIKKWVA